MAALQRWAPWKGLAIPREPRLALQPQVASESTIYHDAAHSYVGTLAPNSMVGDYDACITVLCMILVM